MKKRRPGTVSKGTAAELAARATGYTGNGLSIFSRAAAHGGRPVCGATDKARTESRPHVFLLARELIAKTDRELSRLQHRLVGETSPAARAKLEKGIAIKVQFLCRLYAQQTNERTERLARA